MYKTLDKFYSLCLNSKKSILTWEQAPILISSLSLAPKNYEYINLDDNLIEINGNIIDITTLRKEKIDKYVTIFYYHDKNLEIVYKVYAYNY